jgi:hypothetical protein
MEEEDVVDTAAGCAARAERRVGEGIAIADQFSRVVSAW